MFIACIKRFVFDPNIRSSRRSGRELQVTRSGNVIELGTRPSVFVPQLEILRMQLVSYTMKVLEVVGQHKHEWVENQCKSRILCVFSIALNRKYSD